jgi:hypothetical protein
VSSCRLASRLGLPLCQVPARLPPPLHTHRHEHGLALRLRWPRPAAVGAQGRGPGCDARPRAPCRGEHVPAGGSWGARRIADVRPGPTAGASQQGRGQGRGERAGVEARRAATPCPLYPVQQLAALCAMAQHRRWMPRTATCAARLSWTFRQVGMDSPSAPPPRGPLALRASLAQHSSVLVKSAPPPPPSFTHTHADLRFEVAARRSDSACTCRGIYLRDPQEARTPLTFQ